MIINLQMITIYVQDMARSVEFYTKKLGFTKWPNTTMANDQEARFIDPDGNEFLLHT